MLDKLDGKSSWGCSDIDEDVIRASQGQGTSQTHFNTLTKFNAKRPAPEIARQALKAKRDHTAEAKKVQMMSSAYGSSGF